jgi:hypothetical protein
MFHGLVPDSPVLYAGVKMTKKARRKSKDVEVFTPEFKARFTKLVDDLDEWSKAKYEEAKKKKETR